MDVKRKQRDRASKMMEWRENWLAHTKDRTLRYTHSHWTRVNWITQKGIGAAFWFTHAYPGCQHSCVRMRWYENTFIKQPCHRHLHVRNQEQRWY